MLRFYLWSIHNKGGENDVKKLNIIMLLIATFIITGCGKANVTMTNKIGHSQVYCILTYDSGQDAQHLDNNHSISKTGLNKQTIIVSAYKREYMT